MPYNKNFLDALFFMYICPYSRVMLIMVSLVFRLFYVGILVRLKPQTNTVRQEYPTTITGMYYYNFTF